MTHRTYRDRLVVRTKLLPPRSPRHTLHRARLTERLLESLNYRVTILQAGTGYGKSTALAALAERRQPLAWYHLDEEDADPLVLLLHLVHSLSAAAPGFSEAPLVALEDWDRETAGGEIWPGVVDMIVSELVATTFSKPLLLVLDDAHHLNKGAAALRVLDRLAGRAPADLHLILSTRYPLQLPTLLTWRVRGELLEIGQRELAFTLQETKDLFRQQYGYELSREQAELLMNQVEGWPIALPLVWQRLQGGNNATLADAVGHLSGATGNLFAYLAQEVLAQQPADVRAFLEETAVLRQMTAPICDAVRDSADSDQMLRYLQEQGLFVLTVGDGHMRYHYLFRELLRKQLAPERQRALHARAAGCYRKQGEDEEAIYHLLGAGAYGQVAELLSRAGRDLLRAGRLDLLSGWLGSLPPDVLQGHPALLAYLGDVSRLHSRFDEALGWYQQAEARSRAQGDLRGVAQALRGQARVYLDTVNPSKAERLLEEALRLSDGRETRESRARLLELLAENQLNQGRLQQAEAYRAEAQTLRDHSSGEEQLAMRVLLRTGRLEKARRLLEARAEAERQNPVPRPRAHRETLLLLSLIYAFQGERDEAYRCAVEGTRRGEQFDSPFVTAVGHMRQGHAWLLQKDEKGYDEAAASFGEAIAISERLQVPRLRVEASWGLCQTHGFRGDLGAAERVAAEGIEIAREAGDEWVEACIRATLGAGFVLSGRGEKAAAWLDQAAGAFRACADTYGETVVRLWQALLWQETGDRTRLERDVEVLLRLARANDYDFLFSRRTLLGPPDPRVLLPLLIFARDNGLEGSYASRLLSRFDLAHLELHPGYRLRVQTLGPFRLWRGDDEVTAGEWTRKKARELFHLLLTYRHTLLEREQTTEILWPDLEPEAAQRDFKIAYSTLCRVLEPERRRNAPSAYVLRDGSRYGLRSEADMVLDVDEFDRLLEEGDKLFRWERSAALEHYQQALDLYHGEYLQEYPYAEWASEERERLLTAYLRMAERLATILSEKEAWEAVIAVCQAILARDDCWEGAYRMMMRAYGQLGNRPQALRTYRKCEARLRAELGVEPMAATIAVYEGLR